MKFIEQNLIKEYSQGNIGAAEFIIRLFSGNISVQDATTIVMKLEQCETIKGTNLYVLWKDLCDKNIQKVVTLCENCPDNILEDACSRQDYTGRKLIKNYL